MSEADREEGVIQVGRTDSLPGYSMAQAGGLEGAEAPGTAISSQEEAAPFELVHELLIRIARDSLEKKPRSRTRRK